MAPKSRSNGSRGVRKDMGLNSFSSIRKWNKAGRRGKRPICFCGLEATVLTSITYDNPGRRFNICSKESGNGCGFWEWIDPPMCNMKTQFIPLMTGELIDCRNSMTVKESVMGSYEAQIRRNQKEITLMKEELEVAKLKKNSAMEELSNLEDRRGRNGFVLDKGNVLAIGIVVFGIWYLTKLMEGIYDVL